MKIHYYNTFSTMLCLSLVTLLLLSVSFVVAQEKNIDYYLDEEDKEKIEEFKNLNNEEKNKILNSATDEQRVTLLEELRSNIYLSKVLEAGGSLSEATGNVNPTGIREANYPSTIAFKGFENSNLKFYGDENTNVIGDSKVFLNLESLPKWITEIEYQHKEDKGSFVLRGADGEELELSEGSTNEEGELAFSSSRDEKIGNERFSKDLEDYEVDGKIGVTEDGFVLHEEDSELRTEDFTFNKDKEGEQGLLTFNDDGIEITNMKVEKEGTYVVGTKTTDKPFRIVMGDDWSTFIGNDYPDEITLNDVGKELITRTGFENGVETQFSGYVDKEYGEISIIPEGDGSVYTFQKDGETLDVRGLSLEELQQSDIYKSSSKTLQGIMSGIVENSDNANMNFLASQLFPDNDIVRSNGELFNQFFSNTDLSKVPAGMAISSENSDGTINVFVNPKDVGGLAVFHNDIGMLSVGPGEGEFKIDVNPSNVDKRMDLSFVNGEIKQLGKIGDFEIGIDEIRLLNNKGNFDINNIRSLEQNNNGEFELVMSDEVTVFSAKIDPLQNQLVVNNGEAIVADLRLPVDEYVSSLEKTLDQLSNLEANNENIYGLIKTGNQLLDFTLSDSERERITNDYNAQLELLKGMEMIPQGVRDSLPETLPGIPSSEEMKKVIHELGTLNNAFLTGLQNDIQSLRDNPAVGDIRMTMDISDARNLDTSNIENFADQMSASDFELNVGLRLPHFETVQNIDKYFLYSDETAAAAEGLSNIQNSIFENSLTQTIIEGALAKSVFPPQSPIEVNFWPDTKPPYEVGLKNQYRNELSSAISQVLSNTQLQGETNLVFRNNANGQFSVGLQNKNDVIPLDLSPHTNAFVRDSVITSFRLPSNLRGYYDAPGPFNVQNSPVIPNNVYAPFCNSVGYKPGFCYINTGKNIKSYIDTYFLQSVK